MPRTYNAGYQAKWYAANKETHLARVAAVNKRKFDEAREHVLQHLLVNPCVDCGESDPIVLEFDHCRGVKEANISHMVKRRASLKRISAEINKCDVVCANCHKRRSARRAGDWYKAERDRTV